MRRMFSWLGFAVVAFGVIVVAVSNRHAVPFYFWPGGQGVELRLFALVLSTTFAAYLLGRGSGLWRAHQVRGQLRQTETSLRMLERERDTLVAERDRLKAAAPVADSLPTTSLAAVAGRDVA